MVSFLTEELVRRGHEVTLFASGDSVTKANLVPVCPRSLRLDAGSVDQFAHHVRMLEEVYRRAPEFDIVHFNIDYMHFPLARRQALPYLTTLHGRQDLPDLAPLYRTYNDAPVVSISNAQRTPLPFAHWVGTVYHGLPPQLLRYHPQPGKYLAFLGRISKEKRVDRAIELARHVGMPLKIAAKVDKADREYFQDIKPLLDDPLVEFVGEINESQKDDFLGNAAALLFPIDWPEPFGLVMIEAMACGTPVVAFNHGSVPEVMKDGVSGYVVNDMDEARRATERVLLLSRGACRDYFDQRFTVGRMAADYENIYHELVRSRRAEPAAAWSAGTGAGARLSVAAVEEAADAP